MNENPVGTPNPLNPTPIGASPSEPVREVSNINPQAEVPKKKKTGLIVGLVICLFVAVGCGVAAALMLINSSKDPVSFAVAKMMSGEIPANVGVSGKIEVLAADEESPLKGITVELNSQLKTGSMVNTTAADIVLTLADAQEYAFGLNEVSASKEELFVKIEKKEESLLVKDKEELDETNCADDETGETNCLEEGEEENIDAKNDAIDVFDSIIDMIAGQWLRFDLSTDEQTVSDISGSNELICLVDALKDLETEKNGLAEAYNKNPFIGSATENIPVNSKLNQLRQITIDDEKFVGFFNTLKNTPLVTAVNECMGGGEIATVTLEDVNEVITKIPAIYVEVNSDGTFSRFYTVFKTEDEEYTIKVDLSFTYPTTINVTEPTEYTDFNEFIQNLFSFGEVEEVEVVE